MLEAIRASSVLGSSFQHLVWVAVDSVVTHLYPRGAGIHARVAIEQGASRRQVIETLEIATAASFRGVDTALAIVLQAATEAGRALPSDPAAESRARIAAYGSAWPEEAWDMQGPGLGAKSRALLHLACAASPALSDQDGMRAHAAEALRHGASAEELIETVQLAQCIATHALADGIMAMPVE